MKHAALLPYRVKLCDGHSCHRTGDRKRKSVRGGIVNTGIGIAQTPRPDARDQDPQVLQFEEGG
ncbi:hypothetical protein FIBSPDRAFT_876652 [Athelia psychrophila]|uniref:Uncharacterized protein n=1 Tax=Athelia psychrophila TaxID=1759441 RepID=A0A167WNV6_9AGAM|nr:hypothetical protein FIBSPDRAFT_876652 [Fibularhizoctonia sp. CBS 109695]